MASHNDAEPISKSKDVRNAVYMVVAMGMTPKMALDANSSVNKSSLSREVSRIVEIEADRLWREELKSKASECGSISSLSTDKESALTCLNSTLISNAPWNTGGKSHFQKKVETRLDELRRKRRAEEAEVVEKSDVKKLRTRRSTSQINSHWINEQREKEEVHQRYKNAFKEATIMFSERRQGKTSKTYNEILTHLNTKYSLDGSGRTSSREKKQLALRTVTRSVDEGKIGVSPPIKGPPRIIDRDFCKLVALHAGMCQVGDSGEATAKSLKRVMITGVLGTPHEDEFNMEFAWEVARRENAEIMHPSGGVAAEDVRWQWCNHESINKWFDGLKDFYLEFGFGKDEPFLLEDGTFAEITILEEMKPRMIHFDETDHPLGDDRDKGGSRNQTYINPLLCRGGSRSTRGGRHVSGGYSVTNRGERAPDLWIFDSSAKIPENMTIQDAWIEFMGRLKARYGHNTDQVFRPYVAVRPSGGMEADLFMAFIERATLDMFPEETLSLEKEYDAQGKLVKGPVVWHVDCGPGRLASVDGNKEYDEWLVQMKKKGILIYGLCPNTTSVTAVMDDLYSSFKLRCRSNTQKIFAQKVKSHALEIRAKRKLMKEKLARGETVKESEKPKVRSIVSLSPADLGRVVYGDLDADGFASEDSPIATCFSKERILQSIAKLGYDPFTRSCLNNPKVRHEVGQSEDTDQVKMMEDMSVEYEELKQKCAQKGFCVDAFDAELPKATKNVRAETMEARARELAKSGHTAKAGAVYRKLGTMLLNGDEILLARRIEREMKEEEKQQKAHKGEAERQERWDAAMAVFEKFESGQTLRRQDYVKLIRFIVPEENQPGDAIGKYSNIAAMENRLSVCDIPWQRYFDPSWEDSANTGAEEVNASGVAELDFNADADTNLAKVEGSADVDA